MAVLYRWNHRHHTVKKSCKKHSLSLHSFFFFLSSSFYLREQGQTWKAGNILFVLCFCSILLGWGWKESKQSHSLFLPSVPGLALLPFLHNSYQQETPAQTGGLEENSPRKQSLLRSCGAGTEVRVESRSFPNTSTTIMDPTKDL